MVPVIVVVLLSILLVVAIILLVATNVVAAEEIKDLKQDVEHQTEYANAWGDAVKDYRKSMDNLAELTPKLFKVLEGYTYRSYGYFSLSSNWDLDLIDRLAAAQDKHGDYKLAKKIKENY